MRHVGLALLLCCTACANHAAPSGDQSATSAAKKSVLTLSDTGAREGTYVATAGSAILAECSEPPDTHGGPAVQQDSNGELVSSDIKCGTPMRMKILRNGRDQTVHVIVFPNGTKHWRLTVTS